MQVPVGGLVISDIDFLTGTVFAGGANPLQNDPVVGPHMRQSTVFINDTVSAGGPIANLTFDTTGLAVGAGPFALNLTGVAGLFDTHFVDGSLQDIVTNVTNGTINIIAAAPPSITVGTVELQPNQPGQQVQFFAVGNDSVGGLQFDIEVELGGPTMTDINLVAGTIFEAGTNPQMDNPVIGPHVRQSTVFIDDSVSAVGPIATVTFDTTGLFIGDGPFDLDLAGVAGGFDTHFVDGSLQDIGTDVVNGSIVIVPEPGTFIVLCAAGVFLMMTCTRYPRIGIRGLRGAINSR